MELMPPQEGGAAGGAVAPKHRVLDLATLAQTPDLAKVYRWWDGARAAKGRLPRVCEVDPLALPPALLPFITLSDVLYDPLRVRVRLAGTGVCTRHGREIKGMYLDELYDGLDLEMVMASVHAVVASREPDLAERRMRTRHDKYLQLLRLVLPLAEGSRITGLLIAIRFDNA